MAAPPLLRTPNPLIKAGRLVDLLHKELPAAPSWIEPAILPKGGKLLFGGHAKIGKSFVMLELTRALATGTNPFGHPNFRCPAPARILMIEQELGEWGLQARIKNIFRGEQPREITDNVFYVSKEPLLKLDTEEGRTLIRHLIADVKPNILIMDPIGKMHNYDENSNSDITKLMDTLDRIVKLGAEQHMSLIYSHHFGKPPSAKDDRTLDPLSPYNFRGASKWYDDADTLVTMNKREEKQNKAGNRMWKILSRWETRQGPPPPEDLYFVFNEKDDCRVYYKAEKKKEPEKLEPPKKDPKTGAPLIPVIPPPEPAPPPPKQLLFPVA